MERSKRHTCHSHLAKVALGLVASALIISNSEAQVIVGPGGNLQDLANLITGNGVQILNPQINCPTGAFGTYDFNAVTGLNDGNGLMLSTGNINGIYGPNLSASTTTEWGTPGDPFLTSIAGSTSYDACTFEFDVIPVGDTLRFNFVFASEEYQEYVGTAFNDAFGFFISGPGISGPPQFGGAANIALIPNSSIPVTINNVNNGNPDIGFPAANPAFFFANPLSFASLIQYDGWTKGLYAQRVVTPCNMYHLKLTIADVGDRKWDSSVFIDAIESNSITLSSATDGGIDNMIEGCNNGTVTFTRTPVTNQPVTVTYFIDGTAVNGTDYPQIGTDPDPLVAKTIVIPANVATASLNINPFADGIDEGLEFIAFYVGNPLCEGTIQDSLIFNIQDFLDVDVSPPLAYVCLGDSLTFDVTEGGTTFTWTPADYLNDPTLMEPTSIPLDDIIYTLTTTVSSCVATAMADVRVTDMNLSANVQNVLCAGAGSGSITLTQTGGEDPVEFLWSGPAGFSSTDQNISNLQPGSYTVLATDRDGCTATLILEVAELSTIQIALSSPEYLGGFNISCFGSNNGQASAVVSGGTPPYTLQWNDAGSQTGQSATGLVAGTYTLLVTDANGCTSSENIEITEPAAITGTLLSRIDVSCFGGADGTATVGGVGGNGPYTFVWNTVPLQNSATATGLAAGFYVVTITDINNCTGNIEIEISQPPTPLSASVAITNPNCSTLSTGEVSATALGGTPPYTYAWTIAGAGNTQSVSNVSAGTYTLTVTDDNGCITSVFFSVEAPLPLIANIGAVTHVACANENSGSILASASGGTTPYTYVWNTLPPTVGNQLTDVPAGFYAVTVTDANGCMAQVTVEVTEPTDGLSISQLNILNPLCHGAATGEISVNVTGGTAPYLYLWNDVPPSTTATVSNLTEGTYNLEVTDANGCSANASYTLTAPNAIIIAIDGIFNVLCSGESTGAISANPSGGVPPYTFLWNDGLAQTTSTATGLSAGVYALIVTDANGCTATIQATITDLSTPLGASISSQQNVACFGDSTGQATVTATGGSGSYSYLWNDPSGQQTATASGLAPGVYAVTVSDNNGCSNTIVLNVTILGPASKLLADLSPSIFAGGFNISCANDTTGTITVGITGGTAPFVITWNLPGLQTSGLQSVINLGAGFYSATVTDANGCTAEASITLTEPEPIEVTSIVTPSSCFGVPNGSISIQITGGVPSYGIGWTDPTGVFIGSSPNLINLVGGSYILNVQDANGCFYQNAITVVQPEDILIAVDSLSDFNGFNTTCSNSSDGSIYITPSGGLMPYTFQWNTVGNPNYSNQEDVINVPPLLHEVVVTDANGCVQNAFVTLSAPDTLGVDFTTSLFPSGYNVSCFGAADGSIEAVAAGGTPGYTYLWIGEGGFGPVFGNPIQNLGPGEYNVLITDENNCTFSNSVVLNSPGPYSIALQASTINGSNIDCNGQNTGSINLITTGGTSPFSQSWIGPNGFSSSSEDLFGLLAGEYCVTVTDSDGCSQNACITLGEPDALIVTLDAATLPNGANVSCFDSNNGSIASMTSGGSTPYTFSWTGPNSFSAFTSDITSLEIGTYCLTSTDANGCQAVQCETLNAPDSIQIVLTASGNILCSGSEPASVSSSVTGGFPNYDYAWTGPGGFSSSTADISNLTLAGVYCLTITDQSGCTLEECINIVSSPGLSLSLGSSVFNGGWGISCAGEADGYAAGIITGGTGPINYVWSGPNGFTANTPIVEGLTVGTYCLDVTDANNCTAQACVDITEPAALANNPLVELPNCSDSGLATITLNTSGGTAPYQYSWSGGFTTDVVLVGNGNFNVFVLDANGCDATSDFIITLPAPLAITAVSPVFAGGTNTSCASGFDGSINLSIGGAQGAISVTWSGPNGYVSNDQNPTGLEAGEYCVEVTDLSGCEAETCITLTEPVALLANLIATDLTCPGSEDGSIEATITGGIPAYIVQWSGPNGFTFAGNSIANLEAGIYCADVTDANGCILNVCEQVTEPTAISIILNSPETGGDNIGCFGAATGSISSVVGGGTGTYTYSWTGPDGYSSTDPNPSGLIAGEYCLTLTDQNSCTSESCITLTEAVGVTVTPNVFAYANGFNVSCEGLCDGSLQVVLSGGTGMLTTTWSGPNGFSGSGLVLSDLCAGLYVLTTEDENGCMQDTEIELTTPDALILELDAPLFAGGTEIACTGESNGSVFSTISGGIPGYIISWTGPDGFSSSSLNISNLFAGTYLLQITDAGGCTVNGTVTLNEPATPLTATAIAGTYPSGNNISCLGSSDGSIDITPAGGIPPYTYNWLGPNGFSQTTQNVSGLAAGEYVLVVIDANNCTYTLIVELDEPATALTTSVIIDSEVLCQGTNTGAIQVIAEGGSPVYTIQWIGEGGFVSDQFSISNLVSGTYTYLVSDANGCLVGGAVILNEGPALVITPDITNAQCDASDGGITIAISGGVEPYEILWDDGSAENSLSDLPAGSYGVSVTDANGCSGNAVIVVGATNSLNLNPVLSEPACFGSSSGIIDIVVIQGLEPISYVWTGTDNFTATTQDLNNIGAGEYDLLAVDANGCMVELNVILSQPDSLFIEPLISPLYPNGFNISTFGGSDGSIFDPVIVGGNGEYDLYWTGPDGFAFEGDGDLGGLAAGTYRLAVLDEGLCGDTIYITLTQPVPLELPNGISPNGDGFNDGLTVQGIEDFPANVLYVYNRWGNLLYEERNFSNMVPWTGINNSGEELPEGTYFVIVEIPERDNLKGYLELRR